MRFLGQKNLVWLAVASWRLPLAGEDFPFVQDSDPPGLVSLTTSHAGGTPVTTIFAAQLTNGYRFACWRVNGAEQRDALGHALNPAGFALVEPTTATAIYRPATADAGTNGIPDWWEMYNEPGPATNALVDADGDGFNLREEYLRDYHPGLVDEMRPGGISASFSASTLALLDTNLVSFWAGSGPPGLIPTLSSITNRNTSLALSDAFRETNGYRFAYWIVNGQIQTDLAGRAASAPGLQLQSSTVAQAVFFVKNQDIDADGVPDWYEYNGNLGLGQSAGDDADGDGFGLLEEYRRDYNPVLRDEMHPGGITLAFSAPTLVIPDTNLASLVIGSAPPNLVPGSSAVTNVGVQVATVDAYGLTNGYRFAYWSLNGAIQTDALGRAEGHLAFALSGSSEAIARFIPSGDDANANGVADWWEFHFLGAFAPGGEGDFDGDGFSLREEYLRDYHPKLPDSIDAGGVSVAFSPATTVITDTNLASVSIESLPPGLVASVSLVTNRGAGMALPDSYGTTNGHRFAHWLLNGAILSDPVGRALGGAPMPLEAITVARAVFLHQGADGNANGVPDWFEYHFLGEFADSPAEDADADGFDLMEEYRRDYHPLLSDEIRGGGISMAFAQPAAVHLGHFRRIVFALLEGVSTNFFGALGSSMGAFHVPGCSHPALGDWNDDGVPDLFVGGSNGVLRVFENTGSPRVPNLVGRSDNFSALSALWAGITNPAPALGDWTGDGEADLAIGGDGGRIVLISSGGNFQDPQEPAITNVLDLATSRAIPTFADADGDHHADLFVLLADGTVNLYPNTQNALAPFNVGTAQTDVLGMAVPEATGIATMDADNDGIIDVLLSDAVGRIWQFRGGAGGTYTLVSRVFAGTYDGFAQHLTITAGDFTGDGSTDLVVGNASGGLVCLKNPAQHLVIDPPGVTLLYGQSAQFLVRGETNAVTWSLLRNPSGGNINPTNGQYTAGAANGMDFVEARAADGMTGRAYVNVISPDEVAGFGKAIVVGGGKDLADPVWLATDYIASRAYNVLRYKGYSRENIRYLSFDPGRDVDGDGLDNDIAGFSSHANVANSLTNWTGNANRLLVYLVDHGSATPDGAYFRLNTGENLTSTQLDAWLDAIQDEHGTEVVVVLDFCYAGRFLQDLTYAGPAKRVVIAATSPTELTYFLSGGMVSFSDLFLSGLLQGLDLEQAFLFARQGMEGYQAATLDDDGDGAYEPGVDGSVAATIPVGATHLAGKDVPVIGSVAPNQTLQVGTKATLWAEAIESYYPIDRAYCTIIPPSFSASTNSGVPVTAMSEVELHPLAGGRYLADVDRFAEPGLYKINYYARDIWGSVSPPRQGLVTQAGYDERMAIVAGGATNDPGWRAICRMASTAYQTALARRLNKNGIRYLSAAAHQDLDGDGTNDVHAAASAAALADSITNWAAGANRLTVCLLGTTTSNAQYRIGAAETLPAADLDGWLDAFQVSNAAALVLMDFDGCGSYVPSLAPPAGKERIVVASTRAGAAAVRAADGLISFSQFFLSGVFNGRSLGAAFADARNAIRYASGRVRQTAQLDDSGNGVPDQKNLDGLVAAQRYIGAAFATG
ncbi:MAG: VCBS repeat-containing protein, partial [Verrucomicrobiae bacterium]|nr:VCBS repeat-containing protein [Verrucomicrobiae bacterium]